jgi:membrane protein DedA with SNARE-associated domain/membrane-associated phospholipid phosphatase
MQDVLGFIGGHLGAALLLVAIVAFAESLAIVGTVVPAALVMFTAGVLIGRGSLDLWTTLAVAILGAALGDALSYELGRRQQARVRSWPLYQRHGAAIERGERLLRRHAGTSVVLARFTGAVRAFVPLLAGFAQMPRVKFYAVDIVSALLWAPAHILPGVLFGTSLALAEAVSERLAVMLLLLAILLWGVSWGVSTAIRLGVPRVRQLRDAAVRRARGRSSATARVALALLDPQQPGSHALLLGSVVVLAAGWIFFGVMEDVLSHDPLVKADMSVFQFLQGLRSPPADRLMAAVTEMGSGGVLMPLITLVLLWLAWRRCWRTAGYWVAVVAFGELLVQVLKITLGRHRPLANIYAGTEQFSFPSGHAAVSTVVLAFLAFLLSRGQTWRVRIAIAVVTGIYVTLVAFSRLYLGAHWLSDVLGGMAFGLTWVAFVAMVYTRRGIREDLAAHALMPTVIAALIVFGGAWIYWRAADDLRRFSAPVPPRLMPQDAWLDGGWRSLPMRRLEVAGEAQEPLPIQWACPEAAIVGELKTSGWQEAPAWSLKTVLSLLVPDEPIQRLPVLPQFNLGERSRLAFVRGSAQRPRERDVLQLWRSEFELASPGSHPAIWYGAVYHEDRNARGYFARTLVRRTVLPVEQVIGLMPPSARGAIEVKRHGVEAVVLLRCP